MRVGTAAGAKGAVYLLKGTTADPRYTSAFLESIGAPPNSCVVMTPNAYVTNEAWDEIICHAIVKIIRSLPVIRDHPNWWVKIFLDGYKAHVNTVINCT